MSAALAYEPFVLDQPGPQLQFRLGAVRTPLVRTMIERVAVAKHEDAHKERGERTASAHGFQAKLGEYKQLSRKGWDVTVLLAPDSRTVVCMAARLDAAKDHDH